MAIQETWDRICAWLQTNAPETLNELGNPATMNAIESAAISMNAELLPDYIQFYQTLDGAESCGVCPSHDEWDQMAFTPMSLEDAVSAWEMLKELLEMGEFDDQPASCDDRVTNVWWSTSWIPFADNGGGDYYCIDLAPAKGGKIGQVISHSHETGEHVVLADSLTEYLRRIADDIEAGKFEYDEVYGLRTKVEFDDA